jgi:hypothetical protein
MPQGSRIAAILALATAGVLVPAGATAPALSLPAGVTDTTDALQSSPTLSTVSVPAVTTPTVTTPTATVPSVTTPVVSSPKVSAPKVTVPNVSTPKVTAPAPSAAPSGSTTGAGDPGGEVVSGGGSSGGGSSLPRLPGGTDLSPPTSGVPGSAAPGASDQHSAESGDGITPTSGGPGTGMPGSGGSSPIGVGGPGGAGTLGAGAFVVRGGSDVLQLRAALDPLLGCYYALSPIQQEVLALRAGLDGGTPISRGQVAAAFGVSPAEVERTERSGLRALRSAATEDGCMSVAGTMLASGESPFLNGPLGPIGFVNPGSGSPLGAAAGATGGPDRIVERRSIGDRLGDLGGSGGGAGPIWVILLITITFCASAGALAREVRRSV